MRDYNYFGRMEKPQRIKEQDDDGEPMEELQEIIKKSTRDIKKVRKELRRKYPKVYI